MAIHNVAFLGFGNVGRALANLLATRVVPLRELYGVEYRVTGVATRRQGWWANHDALDPASPEGERCADVRDWLARSRADVVFETIPLEPATGQPALDYLREVLGVGAHAISANKGPVVHGHRELVRLAATMGVAYRFESAVMDGAPVFSLVRHCLPLAGLTAVRGLFTSTAGIVIEAVERGLSMADGIAEAQRFGIAEADPRYDVEGWDTAVKLCALAAVLFGVPLRPVDVERDGIAKLDPATVRRARDDGTPYRLVGQIRRRDASGDGALLARVAPERVPVSDALGAARGADLVMCYEAEVFPGGLVVSSRAPDLTTTAYGLFTDFLEVIGARA